MKVIDLSIAKWQNPITNGGIIKDFNKKLL